MWDTLSKPWQAAIEMAWEAYCIETVPIGAIVTDCDGNILTRGRNRILDKSAPGKQIHGDMLAHAELNALLDLKLDQESRHISVLYTTMEPCPLCMGAIYMSSIRTLRFASRDPYAGSTNLLGATWYLSRKPVQAFGPDNPALEIILMAISLEFELFMRREAFSQNALVKRWREVVPKGVELAEKLYQSGKLREKKENNAPAGEVIDWLVNQVQ